MPRVAFVVARQTALFDQPAEGRFHRPASGQHLEAGCFVAALDDAQRQSCDVAEEPSCLCDKGFELCSVAVVGEDDAQAQQQMAVEAAHHAYRVAVLHAGGMTSTPGRLPWVSVRMCRLRPLIFLPAS